jgi:hypothetical protein
MMVEAVVITELSGSKKVSCKEAAKLLAKGKVRKAYFRPDRTIGKEADRDVAYVWYNEDQKEK